MERRQFLTGLGTGLALSATASAAEAVAATPQVPKVRSGQRPSGRLRFKLGCQSGPATDEHFEYLARYGVTNIAARAPVSEGRLYSTVDELKGVRALAGARGLKLDILDPVLLPSSHIDRERNPGIMLAQSPEREREVEAFQTLIRNCAEAGIPCIKYNMSILGVLRTGHVTGRGGSVQFGEWDTAKAAPETPLTRAGPVSEDAFWERITWFLDRVVPVAEEYKVRIACHPHDPGTSPEGYQGVHRVLGTIDGLKRFVAIRESRYHGLNFCQGTVSENLMRPAVELFDVIRWFGSRGKIFNVHFRNIVGGRGHFREAFPDEGDVDMFQALLTYHEVGYDGMLMPDHVPEVPGHPEAGLQSFAFAYGHTRGLMQAAEHYLARA
ncbi:mannonate dehydratase [Novosphingobium flavum]|uniref:mannonate dehydratase n=1 Tax=Novosphingobium aerophilum TaxID=2839843 RepID=A0A7X1FB13_9SPHN|nr:mannonate dehydratase [Novosphingobium aerophilum]MBC2653685.1 mannonate dehydratase [Novosphingobium aerophilum]MBC2663357.1 mannonate dehydratase [Novosphingobium aerophilum]